MGIGKTSGRNQEKENDTRGFRGDPELTWDSVPFHDGGSCGPLFI